MARLRGRPQPRQPLAAEIEEVAVHPRLGGELQLGQVEVDALTALGLAPAGVEERERGPEDGGIDGRAVHGDVGLVEVDARARGA
jgi:hypothetical protein